MKNEHNHDECEIHEHGDGCGCGHDHAHEELNKKDFIFKVVVGGVLLVA